MKTMRWSLPVLLLGGPSLALRASAQAEYRNLDAGFPVRVEDATVTERYALDLDVANIRVDALSAGRKRLQLEPRMSYGILPRTEMWLRVTTFFREREVVPRKGIAGFGIGGMYELKLESLHLPAMAVSSEVFVPTGPSALPPSYSVRTALTRSFAPGRLHLNASLASFATRSAATAADGTTPARVPPLDGPCVLAQPGGGPISTLCIPLPPVVPDPAAQASAGNLVVHGHWLAGLGADKTLPLSSIVFVGDIFAERFEGIGRRIDWTSELGARKQLSPHVVVVGSVGRHFRGTSDSSFLVLGATFSRALQLFGPRR